MPTDFSARFKKFREVRGEKKRRETERRERRNEEQFESTNKQAPQMHLPIKRHCEAKEDEFFLVQTEASSSLKLSRDKHLKTKEKKGKGDVAPERLDQKMIPEPFRNDIQPLKEWEQTVDGPNKKIKTSSSDDAPVVPLKRKQDEKASTPVCKKRKQSEDEKIVPVRIEISEFVPPVSIELKPTVTQSTSTTQSTCAAESASSLAAELSPAPLIPSTELPSYATLRSYIVRKKKNVVLDSEPVKDSASSNNSANDINRKAVTLDSRRIKFDSSECRSNVCSLMEMDANSLYQQARSIKHIGDKLEANMFQRILHYADAAVLYLAHAVKIGRKAESLLKGTVQFGEVFQKIRQQQSYMEKDKLEKLQAISSMILSMIHFKMYQFNYESLHANLTNNRVTKTSSLAADSAKPATGAVSSSTPSVVSSSFAANGTEPTPSSSVPHSLWLEGEKYLDLIEQLSKVHDIWREAKMLARLQENVDFFTNMDVEYGPLEMTSPINHVKEYITVAIFRLRNLTAS